MGAGPIKGFPSVRMGSDRLGGFPSVKMGNDRLGGFPSVKMGNNRLGTLSPVKLRDDNYGGNQSSPRLSSYTGMEDQRLTPLDPGYAPTLSQNATNRRREAENLSDIATAVGKVTTLSLCESTYVPQLRLSERNRTALSVEARKGML
jgi:hypothetical protein